NMEAKKKKKVSVVKKKPIENVNSSNSLLNGSALNIEDKRPKILLNSRIPVDDVDQICNPKSDEVYKDWLGYDIDLLKRILESRASPCTSSLWFLSPNCAQLAADTFSVLIAIFDEKDEQYA
ncbi:8170_t:CDS:2, partial [Racocetra persica]